MLSDENPTGGESDERDITADPLFLELRSLAQTVSDDDWDMVDPPASLWAAIEAGAAADDAVSLKKPDGAVVTSLAHHRQRRRPSGLLFGAIAASIVAVVAVASLVTSNRDRVISTTELASLDDTTQLVGTARILERGDQVILDLDLSADDFPTGDDSFLELWVIDEEVAGMHSLGVVDGSGEFVLPAGLKTNQFPIVDVSVEPIDGDPTHSGVSVYRGILG